MDDSSVYTCRFLNACNAMRDASSADTINGRRRCGNNKLNLLSREIKEILLNQGFPRLILPKKHPGHRSRDPVIKLLKKYLFTFTNKVLCLS